MDSSLWICIALVASFWADVDSATLRENIHGVQSRELLAEGNFETSEHILERRDVNADSSDNKLGEELKQLTSIANVKKNEVKMSDAKDDQNSEKEVAEIVSDENVLNEKRDGNLRQDKEFGDKGSEEDQYLVIPVSYLKKELHLNSVNDLFSPNDGRNSRGDLADSNFVKERETYKEYNMPTLNEFKEKLQSQDQDIQELVPNKQHELYDVKVATPRNTVATPIDTTPSQHFEFSSQGALDENVENIYNFFGDFEQIQRDLEILRRDMMAARLI